MTRSCARTNPCDSKENPNFKPRPLHEDDNKEEPYSFPGHLHTDPILQKDFAYPLSLVATFTSGDRRGKTS